MASNRNNDSQDLQINSRGLGTLASFGVRGLRLVADGIPASGPDGQGQADLARDWTATLGLRSGRVAFRSDDRRIVGANGDDSGTLSYRYTHPVAALQWRSSPALNVYLSLARGFESPTFNALVYRPGGLLARG